MTDGSTALLLVLKASYATPGACQYQFVRLMRMFKVCIVLTCRQADWHHQEGHWSSIRIQGNT